MINPNQLETLMTFPAKKLQKNSLNSSNCALLATRANYHHENPAYTYPSTKNTISHVAPAVTFF